MFAAVTGHRPDKLTTSHLPAYSDEQFVRLIRLFEQAIEHYGITHGMSGMALGADQAWARALTRMGIPWTAAVPFEGQHRRWPERSRTRYERMLRDASEIIVIAEDLNPAHATKGEIVQAMHARNTFMLDAISTTHGHGALIALYNGDARGGTAHCVGEAEKRGLRVLNLWNSWRRYA